MNRPTLRQLEYAVAVADEKHFGRAAELVLVSQPALSGQIAELERRLGVVLFERTSRSVSLTEVGGHLIERFRTVLRNVDDLTAIAAVHDGTIRGTLRIAAIPTVAPYLLPPLVSVIRSTFPDVRLRFEELRTANLVEAMERGDLDLGLLATPADTGSLVVETVIDDPFCLALPENHALAGTKPIDISILNDLSVLLLEPGHCLRAHVIDACLIDPLQAGPGRELHSASLATLVQMVASGEGVTLLPKSAVEVEARAGSGVTTRPFRAPSPHRSIALMWRPTHPHDALYRTLFPRVNKAFADWMNRGTHPVRGQRTDSK